MLRAAVYVLSNLCILFSVSDSCSNGTATDTSGPHLISLVKEKLDATEVNYLVVPDEADVIQVVYSIKVV